MLSRTICLAIGIFASIVHPAALVTGGLLVLTLVGVNAHEYFFRWNRRDSGDPDEARAAGAT